MDQNRNIIVGLVIVLIIILFLVYRNTESMVPLNRKARHIGYEMMRPVRKSRYIGTEHLHSDYEMMRPVRRSRYIGYEQMRSPVNDSESVIERVATAPGKVITAVGQNITNAGNRLAKLIRSPLEIQ